MCDSTAVDKAIMAPNVKTSKKKIVPDDYFVMGETAEQILRKLNKKIKKDYQDVGKNFAKEARKACLLYTSPSPRDGLLSRMPSSA